LFALGSIIVISFSGETYRTIFTPNAKCTRTARDTFGTTVYRSPTHGAIDATAISSFATKVRCIWTQCTTNRTGNIVEFTGTAFDA